MTARYPKTVGGWLHARLGSALSTLVPLYLFIYERWSPETRSFWTWSPAPVRFFFAYWDTLPFAAGIGFFLVALPKLLYLAWRKARAWLFAVIIIPLALFWAYWGYNTSGMMREGLHSWFLGLMIFLVVIWRRFAARSNLFFRICNWTLLLRGVETLCVFLLPSIASQHWLVQPPFVLSDTVGLLVMTAGTLWLYVYTFRHAEQLRLSVVMQRSNRPTPNSAAERKQLSATA